MPKTSSFKCNVAKLPVAASWNYKHLIDLITNFPIIPAIQSLGIKLNISITESTQPWWEIQMGILHRGEKMSCGIRIDSTAFAVVNCMRVVRLNLNRTNHGNQHSSTSKRHWSFQTKPTKNNIFNQTVSNPWNSWWLNFCDFHIFCFLHQKMHATTIALNWHLPNSFRIPKLLQLSRSALWVSKWSTVLYSKNLGWKHYSLEFFTW